MYLELNKPEHSLNGSGLTLNNRFDVLLDDLEPELLKNPIIFEFRLIVLRTYLTFKVFQFCSFCILLLVLG